MRKLVVPLSLVLALALAAPAFAAVNPVWNLEGEANFGLMFAQNPNKPGDYRFTGNVHKLLGKLTLSAVEVGENPSAKFEFEVVAEAKEENKLEEGAEPNFGNDAFKNLAKSMNLQVSNVIFTFRGAYWKNGPEVTTQIGRLTTFWDDYLLGDRDSDVTDTLKAEGDGVTITGIAVGPFDASVGFLFPAVDRKALITAWDGSLDGVSIELGSVSHVGPTHSGIAHDLHVGVGFEPVDGLSVKANYALDGVNEGYVYDLNAVLSTIPNLTVEAGVRGIDPNGAWNPTYAKRDDDLDECKDNKYHLCAHDSRSGFHVEVSTTQAGIDLGLRYDSGEHPVDSSYSRTITKLSAGTTISDFELSGALTLTDKVNDAEDSTKVEASVKRSFGIVNASYSFSREKKQGDPDPIVIHTVAADATIDTPIADGVKLSGQVKLDSSKLDGKPQVHTSAEWTAPNGLQLGVHYANYNRKDHGPIPNENEPDSAYPLKAEGFYLTAGYSIKF